MPTRLLSDAGSGSGLYDEVVEFAAGTPTWFQSLGALYTKVGLLIFGVLLVVSWWRARAKNDARGIALSLLAPAATAGAYVLSELLKLVIHEDRPCRGLPSGATVAACPEAGDWSFPSNHATIAAAAAVGLSIAWRRIAPWIAGLAVLMALSRVFVGVHYPHDVLAGLLLGAVVAWIVSRSLEKRVTGLVLRYAGRPGIGVLLFARPPASEAPTRVLPRQPGPTGPPPPDRPRRR
ncbi:phosphatase PAP2 family protein [Amycolatopsis samaneae]